MFFSLAPFIVAGLKNGAAECVEETLSRRVLWFPCRHRHHIQEFVLGDVFHSVMGPSTALEVPMFNKFQAQWTSINQEPYCTCYDSVVALEVLSPET